MSRINTLSGLNNVNVDFRPTITTTAPKTGNANQPLPGADAVPEVAPQPERAEAKSVVKELDVLLDGPETFGAIVEDVLFQVDNWREFLNGIREAEDTQDSQVSEEHAALDSGALIHV